MFKNRAVGDSFSGTMLTQWIVHKNAAAINPKNKNAAKYVDDEIAMSHIWCRKSIINFLIVFQPCFAKTKPVPNCVGLPP